MFGKNAGNFQYTLFVRVNTGVTENAIWLAGMWHATELQATGDEPDVCYQDGVDV